MDFTAVEESAKRLRDAGFQELRESEHWIIEPSKKYFVTKYVSLVAHGSEEYVSIECIRYEDKLIQFSETNRQYWPLLWVENIDQVMDIR